jgi:hypothetical protein
VSAPTSSKLYGEVTFTSNSLPPPKLGMPSQLRKCVRLGNANQPKKKKKWEEESDID